MKVVSVIFLTLALASLLAFAADQTAAPAVGRPAPSFNLPNQEGAQMSLDQFKGKWVVLYFYPKDFTGGCTVEAHNFQRDLEKYTQKNAVILGVSLDTVESHKSFCTKEALNFKLLADPNHIAVDKYGVPIQEAGGVRYAARVSFLIDPSGVVRKVYPKVNATSHSEEVLTDLQLLQSAK